MSNGHHPACPQQSSICPQTCGSPGPLTSVLAPSVHPVMQTMSLTAIPLSPPHSYPWPLPAGSEDLTNEHLLPPFLPGWSKPPFCSLSPAVSSHPLSRYHAQIIPGIILLMEEPCSKGCDVIARLCLQVSMASYHSPLVYSFTMFSLARTQTLRRNTSGCQTWPWTGDSMDLRQMNQ